MYMKILLFSVSLKGQCHERPDQQMTLKTIYQLGKIIYYIHTKSFTATALYWLFIKWMRVWLDPKLANMKKDDLHDIRLIGICCG
jgi:hypothetical protein